MAAHNLFPQQPSHHSKFLECILHRVTIKGMVGPYNLYFHYEEMKIAPSTLICIQNIRGTAPKLGSVYIIHYFALEKVST